MSEKFDLQVVYDNFSSSLLGDDDVLIKEYISSYEELNKFFNLMGTIFSFVSKDLEAKIEIILDLLKNEEACNSLKSVKSMMEYERDNQLLYKQGYTSGSRTLLRLHRGLDFIRLFLRKVGDLKDEEKTGSVCREAYDCTLAKFHPFMIRTGAQLAMFTLPTREQLMLKVCGSPDDVKKGLEMLPKTLEATDAVYQRIEALYTSYDLHKLP